MQTFLPYSSFEKSAKVLDNKRLGKQRVEVLQIYKALTVKKYGWKNHPIVKMWKGYEDALLEYGIAICLEWRRRGFKDSLFYKFLVICKYKHIYPSWLKSRKLHSSHRSNLLRKDKEYYSKFGWKEPGNLPYVWIRS